MTWQVYDRPGSVQGCHITKHWLATQDFALLSGSSQHRAFDPCLCYLAMKLVIGSLNSVLLLLLLLLLEPELVKYQLQLRCSRSVHIHTMHGTKGPSAVHTWISGSAEGKLWLQSGIGS